MDVADDDKDVKLYKASSDLLPELQVKIPLLVWSKSTPNTPPTFRRWIFASKTELQLIQLVRVPPQVMTLS